MLLLDSINMILSNVLKGDNGIGLSPGLVCLSPMLNPAPYLQLQKQRRPVPFIRSLVILVDNLLRSSHGVGILEFNLDGGRVVFFAKLSLLFLKYAQNEPVNYQPAILPEQLEKSLHLAQRDHLRKKRRNPIDQKRNDHDSLFCEVRRQIGQFLPDQLIDDLTVHVQAR